ncbi:type II toxin-antitoxin system HicB family antitoxin [Weissella confusa]|jgi:predicted RNase H-like HicB family nuclease|uniref:type II toxin-antitoxin system HicB family antitoxin n=1 Tax=Weissella confusa TaxID=1583 RepID=UPI0005E42FEF|nr:type II toxin-antitoxin system HicB family antitoxin [Weissella confusa]MBJ7673588.1 HicB family protein [Weissella confusa]COJ23809.1 phage protein [Streptococcus pneumoniae]
MSTQNTLLFYPTVFLTEDDGGISVRVPDVGVATQGTDYQDAITWAQEAVGLALVEETSYPDPSTPKDVVLEEWEVPENTQVIMVAYDLERYRRHVSKTVRRNISIPEYLNNIAKKNNINVSKVATEALEQIVFG